MYVRYCEMFAINFCLNFQFIQINSKIFWRHNRKYLKITLQIVAEVVSTQKVPFLHAVYLMDKWRYWRQRTVPSRFPTGRSNSNWNSKPNCQIRLKPLSGMLVLFSLNLHFFFSFCQLANYVNSYHRCQLGTIAIGYKGFSFYNYNFECTVTGEWKPISCWLWRWNRHCFVISQWQNVF